MQTLREIWRRVRNFFVGPSPSFSITKAKWVFRFGFDVYWDSAPGYHFDRVGFAIYFWKWAFHFAWTDSN